MGLRLRWIAVADASPADATALLGFAHSAQPLPGAGYDMRDLPLGAALPGHYLVLEDATQNPPRLRDAALAQASRRFDLLAGFVFDVVGTTDLALWRAGALAWRLTYEGHEDAAELVVRGDPPGDLAAWRAAAEDDHDIPLRASAALSGFRPDEDQALRFERLRRPAASGWIARLLGRG
ncbi:hypothetical protein [Roseomonas sp. CECT 9278]|uniref:hypothetical protein n=1 Tax=Roseomonas sp. CECT 9278 TaxID=2845823 RepID=UPI001E3EF9CF|nr:hypothetical protein [Roseomonas sp. CECT 9278]CAH0187579.1 hypothetical protein ROS9278_01602 [Roseomonas sp. CECT 9278]